jgi:hypothetical protein
MRRIHARKVLLKNLTAYYKAAENLINNSRKNEFLIEIFKNILHSKDKEQTELKPLIPNNLYDIVLIENVPCISFDKLLEFNKSLKIKTLSELDEDQD